MTQKKTLRNRFSHSPIPLNGKAFQIVESFCLDFECAWVSRMNFYTSVQGCRLGVFTGIEVLCIAMTDNLHTGGRLLTLLPSINFNIIWWKSIVFQRKFSLENVHRCYEMINSIKYFLLMKMYIIIIDGNG